MGRRVSQGFDSLARGGSENAYHLTTGISTFSLDRATRPRVAMKKNSMGHDLSPARPREIGMCGSSHRRRPTNRKQSSCLRIIRSVERAPEQTNVPFTFHWRAWAFVRENSPAPRRSKFAAILTCARVENERGHGGRVRFPAWPCVNLAHDGARFANPDWFWSAWAQSQVGGSFGIGSAGSLGDCSRLRSHFSSAELARR